MPCQVWDTHVPQGLGRKGPYTSSPGPLPQLPQPWWELISLINTPRNILTSTRDGRKDPPTRCHQAGRSHTVSDNSPHRHRCLTPSHVATHSVCFLFGFLFLVWVFLRRSLPCDPVSPGPWLSHTHCDRHQPTLPQMLPHSITRGHTRAVLPCDPASPRPQRAAPARW